MQTAWNNYLPHSVKRADKPTQTSKTAKEGACVVPTLRVRLVKDVRILPEECLTTQVKLEGEIRAATYYA